MVMALLLLNACGAATDGNAATSGNVIPVVAAENFYGDIVRQIGGSHVSVTSILSDPEVDPHEYETNVQNAAAVAGAKLVIANGGGYDDWMDKLLSGSPSNDRVVLKGFDLATVKLADNEHVWYSIENIQAIARSVTDHLKQLDAANAASYESNLQQFQQALGPVQQKINTIKTKYPNAPVALTETIFLYQSGPLGLHVLTPSDFQKAIAEGNDPPANAVVEAEKQVKQKQVKVLIYNEQTSTAITARLQSDANAQHIPVVGITETMPKDKTYQAWMLGQLTALEQALSQS
ncbi:MAG: zinc ABC transporter substrate-binding protein [Ktedonobacteraceae bacterium]|nr:zinc ABC transporter substrate-binding protein [Ktedonobacteraceae bacterium]MBO0795036.1 zinc ABC transporter substrate-binding protein [Ktedonobacteraceae bacterium]